MKRLITLFILLCIARVSFGQYFTLTPQGFLSADQKEYVVIDMPGIKQPDLYKKVFSALTTIYNNPKEALSVVDGESITISGYEKNAIISKWRGSPIHISKSTYKYDLEYSLSILFKDDKIRFNRPSFTCKRWYEGGYRQGWESGWSTLPIVKGKKQNAGIFDLQGQVISQEAYDGLNTYFNDLLQLIVEKSKSLNDW